MEIDGGQAVIAFDPELHVFRGAFVGPGGGACFLASGVDRPVREARLSPKLSLGFRHEEGIDPYRSSSGRFDLRRDPRDREAAAMAPVASDRSLGEWVVDAIRQALRSA